MNVRELIRILNNLGEPAKDLPVLLEIREEGVYEMEEENIRPTQFKIITEKWGRKDPSCWTTDIWVDHDIHHPDDKEDVKSGILIGSY